MDSKALDTENDYECALKEIERLWNAEPGTPEGRLLDDLIDRVMIYENEHHPIPQPKGTFRPSRHRLNQIAEHGAELLSGASENELDTFTE